MAESENGFPINLEVGDRVLAHCCGLSLSNVTCLTVTRKTATQITLSDGRKLNKRGRIIGQSRWSRESVSAYDEAVYQDAIREAQESRELNELHDVRWWDVPVAVRSQVLKLVKDTQETK